MGGAASAAGGASGAASGASAGSSAAGSSGFMSKFGDIFSKFGGQGGGQGGDGMESISNPGMNLLKQWQADVDRTNNYMMSAANPNFKPQSTASGSAGPNLSSMLWDALMKSQKK